MKTYLRTTSTSAPRVIHVDGCHAGRNATEWPHGMSIESDVIAFVAQSRFLRGCLRCMPAVTHKSGKRTRVG